MAKVFTQKSRKEINFNYRQRKKEKFKELEDEVISLRECVAELKGQLKLLKELHAQLITENGLLRYGSGSFNSIGKKIGFEYDEFTFFKWKYPF
ncbi:13466_t:CDS:2 [Gigaspora margarita]|uniref:13466_t:CDS:1 n=1 Tax=Gigaspora margarita TaxID=4874 RepID=A0ABN7UQN8_GIGMA|nr:13466_t:CDS:2 [Gigaspora margarita]